MMWSEFILFSIIAVQAKLAIDEEIQVDNLTDGEYSIMLHAHCRHVLHCDHIVIYKCKTKLTASEEEQQELIQELEYTKKMGYARDSQISMLEEDSKLMLEKCE